MISFHLVPDDRGPIVAGHRACHSPARARTRGGRVTGALTLWALRDGRSAEQVLAHSVFWAPVFELLAEAPEGQAVVERLMEYLGRAAGKRSVSLKELASALSEHGPRAKEVIMDSVDKLIEEGKQLGLSQGRAEGRAEGRKQMLLDLLALKFGELSPADIARVEEADESALRRYSERVLTADSLAAVLGG